MGVTTVALKVAAITRTVQAKPSQAFSSSSQSVFFLRGGSSQQEFGLVQFGLPRDLLGTTVTSAKIRVAARDAGAAGVVSAQLLGAGFKGTTTWRNQPALAADSTPRVGAFEAGSTVWREIDVTADFQLVAGGRPYFGHRLTIDSTAQRAFLSRNNARLFPQLVLTYATSTPAPQGVQPAGVTALAAPTFSWPVAAGVSKVQARAAAVGSDFSSPTWTSAEIASTIGQVNTQAAGYPGLADNASADFQFRQSGPLGWGPWSVPITVTRDAYSAATIVSPAPGTVTNDYTPPHEWTFPGQAKFRLWNLYQGRTLYDSGDIAGADQEWTATLDRTGVPDGASITSRLRLWDTSARVASPGDPGFVELSWSWTYNSSTATPTPSGFTASVDAVRPVAVLRWSFTSLEPDEFVVERRRQDEDQFTPVLRFPGGEHEVADTRWSVEDPTCPPNTPVQYRVRAVAGGKVSKASPAQSVQVTLAGGVILDPDDSEAWLNVAGDVTSNLERAENTQRFKGPYAQGSVKRVLSLGGIEGSVEGVLDALPSQHVEGRPIRDQLAAAHLIRSRPTRVYRWLAGFDNVPVTVSGLSWMLSGDAMLDEPGDYSGSMRRMAHRVSFDIDQVDEFETDPDGEK